MAVGSLGDMANLKANHNLILKLHRLVLLFLMAQRYKFESKSQPESMVILNFMGCF